MNSPSSALDGKTFSIGVLSVTACILFVGFLLVSTQPTPAYGTGQNDKGGDFLMLTQQLTTSTEGLIVVDAASQRMLLYGFDFNRKTLRIVSAFDLKKLRKPRKAP